MITLDFHDTVTNFINNNIQQWADLVQHLQSTIADDYRIEDQDDDIPMMLLTVSCDSECTEWAYQTGDNSYSGACYMHPHWAVVALERNDDPDYAVGIANEIADQLADLIQWDARIGDGR
jgi:hypothetical protein